MTSANKGLIPRRSVLYGVATIGHMLFTLIFPFFSVPIVNWFVHHNLYRKTIALCATPFFLSLIYFTYKRWKLIKKDRRMILILAASVILYIMVYETVPDLGEKLHVLNFSVFAILVYKTLSPRMKLHWVLLISWIAASALGVVDESLQNFIPGRSGCIHDVLIAVRSGILSGIIAWIFDAYSRKGRG